MTRGEASGEHEGSEGAARVVAQGGVSEDRLRGITHSLTFVQSDNFKFEKKRGGGGG